MAPELFSPHLSPSLAMSRASPDGSVAERSRLAVNLFALGVTLWQLWFKRRPHQGRTIASTAADFAAGVCLPLEPPAAPHTGAGSSAGRGRGPTGRIHAKVAKGIHTGWRGVFKLLLLHPRKRRTRAPV